MTFRCCPPCHIFATIIFRFRFKHAPDERRESNQSISSDTAQGKWFNVFRWSISNVSSQHKELKVEEARLMPDPSSSAPRQTLQSPVSQFVALPAEAGCNHSHQHFSPVKFPCAIVLACGGFGPKFWAVSAVNTYTATVTGWGREGTMASNIAVV